MLGISCDYNYFIQTYCLYIGAFLNNLPAGPTASRKGLKAVDVRTDDVSDESADDMSGELVCPGGSSPKVENREGGPGLGPGLDEDCNVRGVKSKAPKEFDSDGVGLSGCCDEGGRGICKRFTII